MCLSILGLPGSKEASLEVGILKKEWTKFLPNVDMSGIVHPAMEGIVFFNINDKVDSEYEETCQHKTTVERLANTVNSAGPRRFLYHYYTAKSRLPP